MRKFLYTSMLLLFIFHLNGKALILNSGAIVECDSMAFVNIASEYDSLVILLDGTEIGKTPLYHFPVGTGSHRVSVMSPYWPSWNQPNYIDTFVALPGKTYQFNVTFVKNILVNSIPFDANVFKNGELVGRTPMYIPAASNAKISIEKEGYHAVNTGLEKAYEFSLLVTLQPRQEWFQAKQKREQEIKYKIKRKRNLLFASIGFTTIAGLLSVHYRNERNEALNNSSSAIDPSQRTHYRDRAKDFKKLQNMSYIAFELGFVMTGYFFLTSRTGD